MPVGVEHVKYAEAREGKGGQAQSATGRTLCEESGVSKTTNRVSYATDSLLIYPDLGEFVVLFQNEKIRLLLGCVRGRNVTSQDARSEAGPIT